MTQYAFIALKQKVVPSLLRSILKEAFEKYELIEQGSYYQLSVENQNHFLFSLKGMQARLIEDYGLYSSILVVPFVNDIFVKYLAYCTNQTLSVFEVFALNINAPTIKNDIPLILRYIGSRHLDTLKAYLDNNQDANMAASHMFLHRNSYAYRLKKVVEDTSLEYNDFNSLAFIKLCLMVVNW